MHTCVYRDPSVNHHWMARLHPCLHRGWQRHGLDSDLCDDPQGPLGSDEELLDIVADIVLSQSRERIKNVSGT